MNADARSIRHHEARTFGEQEGRNTIGQDEARTMGRDAARTMGQDEARMIGQHIAALRRGHGWSQRHLADAAGVSHGYIGLLERGQVPNPGKRRLDAVARALRLPTEALLRGDFDEAVWDPELHDRRTITATPAGGSSAMARGLGERVLAQRGLGERGALANVAGTLDQVRPTGARPLPVFRWGSCGDPRDRESPPDPDHLEYPPPGRESLIGPNGFGVVVKGESMAGRGIHDGDVVWVNPERPYGVGKVVLALASDVGGDSGMVVKTFARTDVGDCLVSETVQGRSTLVCREFKVIGPVVGITSWRLPS